MATVSLLSIAGFLFCICFVIFQFVWMVQMRRIAKANTEYSIMQIRLLNEYLRSKGVDVNLQKINDETANQINEGKDFNGLSDNGFKL